MKPSALALILPSFALALLAFRISHPTPAIPTSANRSTKNIVYGCSPDWQALSAWLEDADIPPIPGSGSYQWKISTTNDSAQFYFNQGLNMYYSFHIIESMASFKKAARFDPDCAMLYWAQALAYGPNINDMGYAASPEALLAVRRANALLEKANDMEKGLIGAMSIRYTGDSADVNRKQLNEKYTAKMAELYGKYPAQADVATLYADAMMLQHPWDLWNTDGTPKAWTPRIREVLERTLAQTPGNPGANHYYIHVMEPSPFAEKAIPSANRLGALTPGLSHTVHMPSHIYLRTGDYNKGVVVNEKAVSSYMKTIPLYAGVTGADFLYIIHNLHMQVNNSMMAGRSAYSSATVKELINSIQKDYLAIPGAFGSLVQYVYMTPVLVDVRFGNWNALLKMPAPSNDMVYGSILYQFGKGMAMAHTDQLDGAKAALREIEKLSADSVLRLPFEPFSKAIEGVIVAENLLRGTIALRENDHTASISAFEKAVDTEEHMVYNEPRDWLLNPKHYLADALLKAGRPADAEKVCRKDLENNRENGWALFGYWQALKAQKKDKEAGAVMIRYKKAFAKADITLSHPVF